MSCVEIGANAGRVGAVVVRHSAALHVKTVSRVRCLTLWHFGHD